MIKCVDVLGKFFFFELSWARCHQADGIGGVDSRVGDVIESSKRKIDYALTSKRATLAEDIREYHKRWDYAVPRECMNGLP